EIDIVIGNLQDNLLGCSECGNKTEAHGQLYRCASCRLEWKAEGRIVYNRQQGEAAAFDSLFEQMQAGNQDEEVRKFCYEQQAKLAVGLARPGSVVLDVGCGPELAYRKPSGTTIIGVEPSLPALKANTELDLGIWGTAACL